MNGRVPFKLRALWWLMVRAERVAQWCRARWVRWHDNRGAIISDEDGNTPTPKIAIRRPDDTP